MEDTDRAFEAGFNKVRNGILAEELADMSDDNLASWQAGWKPRTAQDILAEKEWQRRMMTHEFQLNRKIAWLNIRWGICSAVIAVLATLAGAWMGGR
ncbi:hypothetical protein [Noviherbaspirillum sp.]|uniref:hypothetical protein n=1 Tax=Noviherbaspirillum sp. TaxID=1926288 RepID=UPI002FE07BB3